MSRRLSAHPARAIFLRRVAAGAASLGCISASRMISAQTRPANTTVRVCLPPTGGVTSVVYAAKSGLFERAGLDVTIEVQNSGAAAAAAVASGAYDIGQSSITSLLLAHEKGLPFTLVAPSGLY